jgi:hypothetical protein
MADYYSILAKAADALHRNTAPARAQLYERARSALISKLESDAAIPGLAVAAAKIVLASAIARIEAEAIAREPTQSRLGQSKEGRDDDGSRVTISCSRPAHSPAACGTVWLARNLEQSQLVGLHSTDAPGYLSPRARQSARPR